MIVFFLRVLLRTLRTVFIGKSCLHCRLLNQNINLYIDFQNVDIIFKNDQTVKNKSDITVKSKSDVTVKNKSDIIKAYFAG